MGNSQGFATMVPKNQATAFKATASAKGKAKSFGDIDALRISKGSKKPMIPSVGNGKSTYMGK